jgi:aromatic ring-opening dioxygenase catalytic subunit (LigB family)
MKAVDHESGERSRASTMPVLFIGHGSPMNIVLDNGYTRSLRELGKTLPRPQAVLVVSAHWLTRGSFVSCQQRPELAKGLDPLRDEGILIIGSGNIVHNLRDMSWETDDSFDWAERFDRDVRDALLAGDHEKLADHRKAFRDSSRAVPTNDHYLPMLYSIALQRGGEKIAFTHESIQHGSVSMRCFRIG